MLLCRHCRLRPATMPRCLCVRHWQDRSVRNLYPPTLLEELDANISLPELPGNGSTPTAAPPRSIGKLFAMRMRKRRRQPLFDPRDAECLDANARANDVGFADGFITDRASFAEMLAAARRARRRQRFRLRPRPPHPRRIDAAHGDEDSSRPDWLAGELDRWRAKERRRLSEGGHPCPPQTRRAGMSALPALGVPIAAEDLACRRDLSPAAAAG